MNEIQRFTLFEVGRANVGDARHRPTVTELLRTWNTGLKGSGLRFIGAVGHTGNYFVEATEPTNLSALLKVNLNIRVAVFDASEFVQFVTAAQNTLAFSPAAPQGRRPTAGLVMDLDAHGTVPPLPPDSERLMFADFAAPRVRGVWKLDVLRTDGKALDRTKREGGWGSVSQMMHGHAGGEWTARSMRTINRLALKLAARE
jgi:hypothetical protein